MSQPSSPSLRRVLCGLAPLAAAGSLASVAAGGSTEVFTIMQSTGVGDNAFIEGLEFDRFDRPTKSPTGSRWVALVRNTGPTSGDAMIVVGEGTTITLAALEGASEPEPGRFFSTSDRSVDINEAGQWVAIGNLVGGGSDDDEVIYLGDADGSMVTLPFREGQDIPPGTVLGSNNYGPSIQADGGTSFGWSTSVAATINYYTADASEILLQFGDVLPGQRGGTDFFLETPFSGRNAFQVSDDGGHWFARGELSNGDAVAIVDGAIVLQVGDDIDGELLDQFPGEQNILESTGDWYVRAATDAGTGLAIVSDVVVAREGDLVGGTVDGERWDGGPWA